jgi:tetratricopeptide (TPR) repeat protein
MDALIAAAGRALAGGDVLGALNRVALRDDPPALALRGIALAQLGDYPLARALLRRAARAFGNREARSRARCAVAGAEVALALRELGESDRPLTSALEVLAAHGDTANLVHGRLVLARRQLLLGRLGEAAALLRLLPAEGLPPALAAVALLASAELAARSLAAADARRALDDALLAAERSRLPSLIHEAREAQAALDRPVARLFDRRGETPFRLLDVERLIGSGALVVDACRRGVRQGQRWVSFARRPVLFSLARLLAEAWPGAVDRNALIARAFRLRNPDETHRARLRVEIGRLRKALAGLVGVRATGTGFVLVPSNACEIAVLDPPIQGAGAAVLALLDDGAAWSTSALALALGTSQRTVQRLLSELDSQNRLRAVGRGRSQRWLARPLSAFATTLLLPATQPAA